MNNPIGPNAPVAAASPAAQPSQSIAGAAGAASTPAKAVQMGSEDITDRQQQQSIPGMDQLKGKWKQQVGAAKIAWGKLTEDELLKIEGQQQKLTGLVQERYAVTRDEAEKQVKGFFEKQMS